MCLCVCGLEATGEDKHTRSTFHQQQQQLCPSLLLPNLPSHSLFLFLQLYFVLTLILSPRMLISYSLRLLVSPENSFKLTPSSFISVSFSPFPTSGIQPSHSSQRFFCCSLYYYNRSLQFSPLPYYCSIFFLPPSSSPCPPFTVGCNHICWTMITPLLLFLFFLVFVFSLPPSLLQGGSRLLRQRSREIACYRGSIFHALVNCFVLTLCQSGVVTPAWATRNPVVVLMISGCFHQD